MNLATHIRCECIVWGQNVTGRGPAGAKALHRHFRLYWSDYYYLFVPLNVFVRQTLQGQKNTKLGWWVRNSTHFSGALKMSIFSKTHFQHLVKNCWLHHPKTYSESSTDFNDLKFQYVHPYDCTSNSNLIKMPKYNRCLVSRLRILSFSRNLTRTISTTFWGRYCTKCIKLCKKYHLT